jgi:meso-butanediol dehydrogenase/(S,S)-butanediol dehydrogenase/diacetyl reductase
MTNRFLGKVAIVTGGASGIGLASAELIVSEGGKVMIGDLNEAQGQAVVAKLGSQCVAFQTCDVSQIDDVNALVAATLTHFGGVDILINNAGMGSDLCTSVELSPEKWHKVLAVDLSSVFYACKATIPHMIKRKGGAIVNVASISGMGGDYAFNAYNAAKGAVVNYTKSLALDHAIDNVRVNAVCPGLIATRLTAFMEKRGILPKLTETIPMKRMGTSKEVANLIAFLASDDASFMTGSIVVIDGGQTSGTGNLDLRTLM